MTRNSVLSNQLVFLLKERGGGGILPVHARARAGHGIGVGVDVWSRLHAYTGRTSSQTVVRTMRVLALDASPQTRTLGPGAVTHERIHTRA